MAPILFNQTTYDTVSGKMTYYFKSAQRFSNQVVALAGMSFPNSFFNISAAYGNNVITYSVPLRDGSTYSPSFTLDDGFYTVADINNAIWNNMTFYGFYFVDNVTKENVYYIQIVENPVLYKAQLNLFLVPNITEMGSTYLNLSDAPNAPSPPMGSSGTGTNAVFLTPSINFSAGPKTILGMNSTTYGPNTYSGSYNLAPYNGTNFVPYLSSTPPVIDAVTSISIRCNLINSTISAPTDLLGQVPISVAFSEFENFISSYQIFSDVTNQQFDYIQLTFLDQNDNPLKFFDPELTVTIEVKDKVNIPTV